MQYSAQMTYRDLIGQCLANCNADKLFCKSLRKDNRDIASASFLLRISKPYRPDNWSSLNAPLGQRVGQELFIKAVGSAITDNLSLMRINL